LRIDEKYITKILKNCPKVDFSPNNKGVIDNSKLSKYIDKQAKKLEDHLGDIYQQTHKEKISFEVNNGQKSPAVLCPLFLELSTSIYNQTLRTQWDESYEQQAYASLISSLFEQFRAAFTLVLSGLALPAMAQLRMQYESYLIFKFIHKYPETAKPFLDHEIVKRYRLLQANNNNDESSELMKMYETLLQKYGKEFAESYGWTSKVIEKRSDRKLGKISELVEFEDYKSLYMTTSEAIHSNALSVKMDEFDPFIDPMIVFSSIELLTNSVIYFMKACNVVPDHRILIMNILYALREDLLGEPQGLSN